jgi:hypothetical protein
MAELHDHEPATRADLAGLTQAVLRGATEHRNQHELELHRLRVEINAERATLARQVRSDIAQLRQDLVYRLETATQQLEDLVAGRDARLLGLLLGVQGAVVALVATVFHWWL